MSGVLDNLRNKIINDTEEDISHVDIDDKIALGVLLWAVASSDNKFLDIEKEKIKEILIRHSKIKTEDIPFVLRVIKEADKERIDLYAFTSELVGSLTYPQRVLVLEELFRVACADRDISEEEIELLRKISNLFHISHRDFINTKIKIKKEFGIDTFDL